MRAWRGTACTGPARTGRPRTGGEVMPAALAHRVTGHSPSQAEGSPHSAVSLLCQCSPFVVHFGTALSRIWQCTGRIAAEAAATSSGGRWRSWARLP